MKTNTKSSWIIWAQKIKRKKLSETLDTTLILFNSDKSIKEISKIREFKIETIEKQLIELISMGFIYSPDVIKIKKFQIIFDLIQKEKIYSISKIKFFSGNNHSYFEIKCVLAHISLFNKKILDY